jgi:hypothetical protein
VVYMSVPDWLVNIAPRLSKTELRILETLITEKRGNAYQLWKASNLKHYPTVLRTLKKLNKKDLVEVLSDRGARGEKTYIPRLRGSLVFYINNDEKKKIVKTITDESSLSKDVYETYKDDFWVLTTVRAYLRDWYGPKRSLDDVIRIDMEMWIGDIVLNPREEGSLKDLRKLAKIKWARQMVIKKIDAEINRIRMDVQELRKFRETLTVK